MHVFHDCLAVAGKLCACHREEHIGAPAERGGAAHCDQRVHVRREMDETSEAADEELLIDDHDYGGQDHLQKTHGYVVSFKERRKRPSPHRVPHGEIHENDEKAERPYESLLKGRCLVVLKGGFFCGKTPCRRAARSGICRFQACAVACVCHRAYYFFRSSAAFDSHRIGEKAYRA